MFGWQPFFDPFEEMRRLERDLDRFTLTPYEQTPFGTRALTGPTPSEQRFGQGTFGPRPWTPRCDVRESDDFIVVYAELPGLSAQDIKLCLEDENFRICGERKPLAEDEGITWQTMERRFGPFERNVRVPFGINAKEIKATFDNGILKVKIPKPPRFGAIQIMEHEKVKGKEKVLEHEERKEPLGEPTEVPTGEKPLKSETQRFEQPQVTAETPEVTAPEHPEERREEGRPSGVQPTEPPKELGQERVQTEKEGISEAPKGQGVSERPQEEARPSVSFDKTVNESKQTKEETTKLQQTVPETPTERLDTQPTTGANV